ncbi:prepilin peptidase [Undibacterium squillarum]|uniref:prepilin peptidase n=1 Tax=Undibacterium squillarum TaxID=1131567 RepID=UPI0035B1DC8A
MFEAVFFQAPGDWLSAISLGIFGLLIGSFLNVVIHRYPRMIDRETENAVAEHRNEPLPHQDAYNLVVPRSACPHCGHQITALENIPVISYLFLRGKCSECKAPISVRYPLVELVTGLATGGLIWMLGSGIAGLAAVVFLFFLITLTMIDADVQLLPDDLTLSLMWIGLLLNSQSVFTDPVSAIIGAAAGYLVLLLVNSVYKLWKKQDGFGQGDFKLLAALGAWMGWKMLPLIILLSSAIGSVIGITLILMSRMGFSTRLSFGPYLACAGLIALLWGEKIVSAYLGVLH